MIDTTTPLGRAVAAALRLAEKKDWPQISLLEIADEAGLTLRRWRWLHRRGRLDVRVARGAEERSDCILHLRRAGERLVDAELGEREVRAARRNEQRLLAELIALRRQRLAVVS